MSKVTVFETVHEHAAGIDIGAAKIFVPPDGIEVKSFDTFTSGYYECIEYLQQKGKTETSQVGVALPLRITRLEKSKKTSKVFPAITMAR